MNFVFSHRFFILLLAQLVSIIVNANFSTLNFAITCMIESPNNYTNQTVDGSIVWSRRTQGFVLSGCIWGLALFSIPVGMLMNQFGVKQVTTIGSVSMGLSTLLIPVLSQKGYIWVFVLRVILGAGMSTIWPLMVSVPVQWVSKIEQPTALAMTTSGIQIGIGIVLLTSGFICETIGWEYVFFIYGAMQLVITAMWAVFYTDPSESRFISKTEKSFILTNRSAGNSKIGVRKLPVRDAIMSRSLWVALLHSVGVYQFGAFNGLFIPTFYSDILQLSPYLNGIMSAVGWFTQLCGRLFCGIALDRLLTRFCSTLSQVRLSAALCSFIPSLCLIAVGFVSSKFPFLGVGLMLMQMLFGTFMNGSFLRIFPLILPSYTNILMGICSTVGFGMSILQSYLVAYLTTSSTLVEWRIIMFLLATISSIGGILFITFVSVDLEKYDPTWCAVNNDKHRK